MTESSDRGKIRPCPRRESRTIDRPTIFNFTSRLPPGPESLSSTASQGDQCPFGLPLCIPIDSHPAPRRHRHGLRVWLVRETGLYEDVRSFLPASPESSTPDPTLSICLSVVFISPPSPILLKTNHSISFFLLLWRCHPASRQPGTNSIPACHHPATPYSPPRASIAPPTPTFDFLRIQ